MVINQDEAGREARTPMLYSVLSTFILLYIWQAFRFGDVSRVSNKINLRNLWQWMKNYQLSVSIFLDLTIAGRPTEICWKRKGKKRKEEEVEWVGKIRRVDKGRN
jgi:hypothetical protein